MEKSTEARQLPKDKRFGFVFWDDAHSLHATDVVNINDLSKLHGAIPVVTSGWILQDDEHGVSIGGESCGDGDYRNSTFILRAMIHDIWYVKVPRKKPLSKRKDPPQSVGPVEPVL
jgi:hypothetical protein